MNDKDVLENYSRADAIRDGELVDVSQMAAQAGIDVPVALTSAVWRSCVSMLDDGGWHTNPRRLDQMLRKLRTCLLTTQGRRRAFRVMILDDDRLPVPVVVNAVLGPGDDGEPVITVMLPWEGD